jgi:hypothetical protein
VIGAAFYVLVPEVTDKVAPGRSYLVFGLALLGVMIFFPAGVYGGLRLLTAKLTRPARRSRPTGSTTPDTIATPRGATPCDDEAPSEPSPRPAR